MKKTWLVFALLVCFFKTESYAGNTEKAIFNSDSSATKTNKNRLRFALKYSSANTFYGRKDSVSIPVLSPSLKFTSSTNFFLRTALVHTNTTSKVFDELDLELGYRHFFGDRLDASVSYTRMFFSKNVSRLNSVANNDINLYLGYDLDLLYSGLSFNYTSGSQTVKTKLPPNKKPPKNNNPTTTLITAKDYTITWMNSKDLFLYELLSLDDKLIITPEVDLIFGTQNGIQVYRKKETVQAPASSFNIKAFDLSLNLRYVFKNLTLNITPDYTIPVNVPTGDYSSPYFVFYGGIYYNLNF